MCGIAGLIGTAHAIVLVKQMTAALAHRGPDGEASFRAHLTDSDRRIALGHRAWRFST